MRPLMGRPTHNCIHVLWIGFWRDTHDPQLYKHATTQIIPYRE